MRIVLANSITADEVLGALKRHGQDPTATQIEETLARLDSQAIDSATNRAAALEDAVAAIVRSEEDSSPTPPPIEIRLPRRHSKVVDQLYATYDRNPLNPRQLMMTGEVDGSKRFLALVLAYPDADGGVHISEIVSLEPGKGYGSTALRILLGLADTNHEAVHLHAKKIGTNRDYPGTKALRDWYARHGFTASWGNAREGYEMTREPRPILEQEISAEHSPTP